MSETAPRRHLGWVTWSSIGLGAQGIGQFALLAVLARYLTDVQFGVVTATLILIGIGRAVHAGVGPALVQREDLRPEHIRAGFALCMWGGLALVATCWLIAPLVAGFFDMQGLTEVMRVMGLIFVLQAPGLVAEALLQREMKLRTLAQAELLGVFAGYVPLGIGGAVLDWGIWALVAAYLGQAFFKYAAVLYSRPHEWSLLPRRQPSRDLLWFSGGFVAARLCNVAGSEGDNLVVGKWMSAAHLGVYGRAYRLMAMPAMFLGEVVDRVIFPLLARAQDDKPRLALAYGRGVSLVATVMTPVAVLGVVLAPEIVHVVLGSDWRDAITPVAVLMTGLVFRTGYKLSDVLARATGTVYARAWRQAVFALLIFAGAWIGTRWGVTGVSAGVVGALAVNYTMMAWLSLRTCRMTWTRFGALHLRGLATGSACAVIVLLAAESCRRLGWPSWVVLLAAGGFTLAALAAAARLLPRLVFGAEGMWLYDTLLRRDRSSAADQRGSTAPR